MSRPRPQIELAESLELVRVAGQEGQHARLDRAEIPDDETMPRRRDEHAAAQVPDHSQHVAIALLDGGVVAGQHHRDRFGDGFVGLQQLGPFQVLRLEAFAGPSPGDSAVDLVEVAHPPVGAAGSQHAIYFAGRRLRRLQPDLERRAHAGVRQVSRQELLDVVRLETGPPIAIPIYASLAGAAA